MLSTGPGTEAFSILTVIIKVISQDLLYHLEAVKPLNLWVWELMHDDLRYHVTVPETLATCFSFGNMSFPCISSPSYSVFHSEAKFYILGFEFCVSERAPSKMFLFQRPASPWLSGQTGRHSPL